MIRALSVAGLSDLETRIVKATYDDDDPPKAKHVQYLVSATSHVDLLHYLDRRLTEGKWNVVLKTLILAHKCFLDGSPRFLADSSHCGFMLELTNYIEQPGIKITPHYRFIKKYAEYLSEKLTAFTVVGVSCERKPPQESKSWAMGLTNAQLVQALPAIQRQFDRLILCVPYTNEDIRHPIPVSALSLLIKDAFRLYSILTIQMLVVLEKFESMDLEQTTHITACTQRFLQQNERFKKWANKLCKLDLVNEKLLPNFDAIPNSFIQLLEQHAKQLKDGTKVPKKEMPAGTVIESKQPTGKSAKAEKAAKKSKPKKSARVQESSSESEESDSEESEEEQKKPVKKKTKARKGKTKASKPVESSSESESSEEEESESLVEEKPKTKRATKGKKGKQAKPESSSEEESSESSEPEPEKPKRKAKSKSAKIEKPDKKKSTKTKKPVSSSDESSEESESSESEVEPRKKSKRRTKTAKSSVLSPKSTAAKNAAVGGILAKNEPIAELFADSFKPVDPFTQLQQRQHQQFNAYSNGSNRNTNNNNNVLTPDPLLFAVPEAKPQSKSNNLIPANKSSSSSGASKTVPTVDLFGDLTASMAAATISEKPAKAKKSKKKAKKQESSSESDSD